VTAVLLAKEALQVPGQLIPPGLLVTVPEPLGVMVTWRVGTTVKVAVTAAAAVITTEQVLVPLHAPLQPENVEPLPGEAASVTVVLPAKFAVQLDPQLMPDGVLVTTPVPETDTTRGTGPVLPRTRPWQPTRVQVEIRTKKRAQNKTRERHLDFMMQPLVQLALSMPEGAQLVGWTEYGWAKALGCFCIAIRCKMDQKNQQPGSISPDIR
jgi:hypothetical protein